MHRATLLSILCIFFLSFVADAQVDPAVQKAKEEVKAEQYWENEAGGQK